MESEICEDALKIVRENTGTVFTEDDKTVIYKGDPKKHLHTRVFINKNGEPTYEAKELALAHKKELIVKYDKSVIITASEQDNYFKVVFDALAKINSDLANKTIHISHGMVKLPGAQKMTSRKGKIIPAQWLLDTAKQKVRDIMLKNGKLKVDDIDAVCEKVAIAAIKYAFLKVGIGNDISFDFDTSIQFDGDTGPYLMYVYTRCFSLLSENNDLEISSEKVDGTVLEKMLTNTVIKDLVTCLSTYKTNLLKSAETNSPSTLCQYLFDLGQKFNAFYQSVRISSANLEEKKVLLYIVKMTMETMRDGLSCLGIETVNHM